MKDVEKFREIMIESREKNNLSISELARLTEKSPSFICDIEKGRKKPSFETSITISRILNISLDKIISKNYA